MITYRPVTLADTRAVHDVFFEAISEVDRKLGAANAVEAGDLAAQEADWLDRRTLFEHLGATTDLAWLAEEDGLVVGYARSILRGDARELTEFFVKPGHQGGGIGREVLSRAFPAEPGVHRTIIATLELSALVRYLSSGLTVQTLIGDFGRPPVASSLPAGLTAEPITATPTALDALAELDQSCLGHRRDADHRWLLADRQGFLYRRAGRVIGYGYAGRRAGPFAALAGDDLPDMLRHAETVAAEAGTPEFYIWVPLTNRAVIDHVLANRFRLDPFIASLFADRPVPGLDRYVITSPPFFL